MDVEAALRCSGRDLPIGIHLVQGRAGEALPHSQLPAILGGQRVAAVLIDAHRPNFGIGIAGELAVCQRERSACVIKSVVHLGQRHRALRIIDNDPVSRMKLRDEALLPSIRNFVESLRKEALRLLGDGAVGAPVALVCIPFQVQAPAGVLYVVAAVGCRFRYAPVGIYFVQGHAGVALAHGQLLAVRRGKGIGAVVIDADGPDIALRVACQDSVFQRHVCAVVIKAGVGGRQRFTVDRVIDNHPVAVVKQRLRLLRLSGLHRICGLSRFYRRAAGQLVQGKVRRIAVGIAVDCGGFVGPELAPGAFVAGQDYGIFSLTGKPERAVCAGHGPAVIAGGNAVVVSSGGRDGNAVTIRQPDAVPVYRQGPGVQRIGYRVYRSIHRLGCNPAAVQDTEPVACLYSQYILS